MGGVDCKAKAFGGLVQGGTDRGGGGFRHQMTGGADQEGGGVRLARVHAGGKGVQAVDAVNKPLFDKEIQCAVGDGGLVAETISSQALQHVICPKGAVMFQQNLQHAAADGGEAHAFGGGQGIGAGQHITGAMRVIVQREGKIGRGTCGAGGIMRVAVHRHLGGLTCYSITSSMRASSSERRVVMRYTITIGMASLVAMAGIARAEVPGVVTDIPPVHSLVAQVMGDLGTPELLLEKGASEHSFQLRPSQAAGLNDADLVVWIGPELTPWLDRALESVPLEVTRLGLLDAPGTITQAYGEGVHEGDVGHMHDGIDPHAWLKPANAQVWLVAIAGELGRLDPEHAATYTANAVAAVDRVVALDAEVAGILAPAADQPVIVFHEAFGYFAAQYDIHIAGAIAEGDAAAPGAARIAELREMVMAGGAVCVFPEVQHDPVMVEQMVEGTAARIGVSLDPVGSSLEPGAGMYAALLTGMARGIADCIAGG
jgi:zinc transport system substrate-binding protein